MSKHSKHPSDNVEWDRKQEVPVFASSNDDQPFDPLNTKNLAIAVAKALLERKAKPLIDLATFRGAGIYCIYYVGTYQLYQPMADENRDADNPRWPIYIGRAIPPGGRTGQFNLSATDTPALYNRLREHADSLRSASNLDLNDFVCRFLIVQDLWIPLAEQLLIAHFAPVWNNLVVGFGNHDPGSGRYGGLCPRWDVLHPGRVWAARLKPRLETVSAIEREVTLYLRGAAVPSVIDLENELSTK